MEPHVSNGMDQQHDCGVRVNHQVNPIPVYSIPGYPKSGYTIPGYTVSGYPIPGYAMLGYSIPGYVIPGYTIPGGITHGQGTLNVISNDRVTEGGFTYGIKDDLGHGAEVSENRPGGTQDGVCGPGTEDTNIVIADASVGRGPGIRDNNNRYNEKEYDTSYDEDILNDTFDDCVTDKGTNHGQGTDGICRDHEMKNYNGLATKELGGPVTRNQDCLGSRDPCGLGTRDPGGLDMKDLESLCSRDPGSLGTTDLYSYVTRDEDGGGQGWGDLYSNYGNEPENNESPRNGVIPSVYSNKTYHGVNTNMIQRQECHVVKVGLKRLQYKNEKLEKENSKLRQKLRMFTNKLSKMQRMQKVIFKLSDKITRPKVNSFSVKEDMVSRSQGRELKNEFNEKNETLNNGVLMEVGIENAHQGQIEDQRKESNKTHLFEMSELETVVASVAEDNTHNRTVIKLDHDEEIQTETETEVEEEDVTVELEESGEKEVDPMVIVDICTVTSQQFVNIGNTLKPSGVTRIENGSKEHVGNHELKCDKTVGFTKSTKEYVQNTPKFRERWSFSKELASTNIVKAKIKSNIYCGECSGCLLVKDCAKCLYCKDKLKFGGPGLKKQKCQLKFCINDARKMYF